MDKARPLNRGDDSDSSVRIEQPPYQGFDSRSCRDLSILILQFCFMTCVAEFRGYAFLLFLNIYF